MCGRCAAQRPEPGPDGPGRRTRGDFLRISSLLACGAAAVIGVALAPAAASASPLGSAGVATSSATSAGPTGSGSSDPDTTVTFSVTSGALTITAPVAANLGTAAPDVSGALGVVVVTDNRALLSATWTATAASTSFVTGSGTGPETIPVSDVSYSPNSITTSGTITVTPHNITMSGAPQPVVVGSAGTGDNTASWNPTISVNVPPAAVFGTYTGTISHSVS